MEPQKNGGLEDDVQIPGKPAVSFRGGYPSHKYDVVRATSDLLEISWRRDCSKSEGEAEAMLNCQGMSMSIV